MDDRLQDYVAPTRLWKRMPLDRRMDAARAFWQNDDEQSQSDQIEAILALSRHMKFRPQSMQSMPLDKRAKYLAQLPGISEGVAARALVSYHLAHQRPMMGAFLDALGIDHDHGLITAESVDPPNRAKLEAAAAAIATAYPAEDVSLYLNTLLAQDPGTWEALTGLPQLAG